MDAWRHLAGVEEQVAQRQGLHREGQVHDLDGVALAGGQVHAAAVTDDVDDPVLVEAELLDLRARNP